MRRSIPAFLIPLALCGCTYVNRPLNSGTISLENRAHNHTLAETFAGVRPIQGMGARQTKNTSITASATQPVITPQDHQSITPPDVDRIHDGYFVGLALSGGGSRSANFAAGCMFQLQRIGLLQKVDYISSVSGGSLTAAYYCLNHKLWNPQNVQRKLTYPFATNILLQTLLPWDMYALVFSDYDRSDMLAAALRDNLFNKNGRSENFADLLPDRPHLLINATDLQSGRRFVFCNQSFDDINSDLSKYPIAYAVAASASVPVVLHEVTLRDFSTTFVQYRHLVDGGLTDNLGIETLVETYQAQVENARNHSWPDPYPNGAIFIVVDAHVDFDAQISSEGDPGFLASVVPK